MYQFVKSKLDVCWSKEFDENGKIVYYYKPDNFSTYQHPHLHRLKNAVYDYREEEQCKLELDNADKNMDALHQINQIKQSKVLITGATKEGEPMTNRKLNKEGQNEGSVSVAAEIVMTQSSEQSGKIKKTKNADKKSKPVPTLQLI